ncbi:MAG: GHKL domain-containing protein [Proteobacteria bacterium]|nr:MAG: GHKL domain-containing protein [Pseudomonadota bacterium]
MTPIHLKVLTDTIQRLSLARSLQSIMEVVRSSARQLSDADGATFVLKEGELCYYAEEDAIAPLWKGQRFPLTACISGWAMLNRQPAIIEDIYQDDRIPIDAYSPTFVKSLVMVPIRIIQPIGAIGIYWAKQYKPSEEQVQILQSLADMTSVAIENVYVYKELEQRVQERTNQLESLNKELEAFSYSVSHDLRAPLRIIGNYATMLEADFGPRLEQAGNAMLKKIIRSANKMNVLIDDLLEFARLGQQEVNKTKIDMNALVRAVLDDLHKAGPENLEIKIGPLEPVEGDYNLLYQVMVNLVSNAIKYSRKTEHPKIEISSRREEGQIIYCIRDNGVGFDMRYADKLFGVFQRLHSSSDYEGTGVGLALTKRIIEKHEGEIWAESKPQEGAIFSFSLEAAG